MAEILILGLAAGVSLICLAYIMARISLTELHNHKYRILAKKAPDCCMCGGSLDDNGWCGDMSHATLSARDWALDQMKSYGE